MTGRSQTHTWPPQITILRKNAQKCSVLLIIFDTVCHIMVNGGWSTNFGAKLELDKISIENDAISAMYDFFSSTCSAVGTRCPQVWMIIFAYKYLLGIWRTRQEKHCSTCMSPDVPLKTGRWTDDNRCAWWNCVSLASLHKSLCPNTSHRILGAAHTTGQTVYCPSTIGR